MNWIFIWVGCMFFNQDYPAGMAPQSLRLSQDSTKPIILHVDSIDQANAATIRDEEGFTAKASVSSRDSLITMGAYLGPGYQDYRIFGYESPDVHSRKMILISIFTSDVKGNPFHCPFGAYYQTSDMKDMRLKYLSTKGPYIQAAVIQTDKEQGIVYIARKWISFDQDE